MRDDKKYTVVQNVWSCRPTLDSAFVKSNVFIYITKHYVLLVTLADPVLGDVSCEVRVAYSSSERQGPDVITRRKEKSCDAGGEGS